MQGGGASDRRRSTRGRCVCGSLCGPAESMAFVHPAFGTGGLPLVRGGLGATHGHQAVRPGGSGSFSVPGPGCTARQRVVTPVSAARATRGPAMEARDACRMLQLFYVQLPL